MKKILYYASIFLLLTACNGNFSKQVHVNNDYEIEASNAKVKNVYLEVNEKKVSTNQITYGENVRFVLNDVEGFNTKNNKIYPDASVFILNQKGDTLFFQDHIFDTLSGIDLGKMKHISLYADVIFAKPIASNDEYMAHLYFNDAKSDAKIFVKYKINLVRDDQIKITKKNLTFNEAYLFSEKTGKVLNSHRYDKNDRIYLIIEGVDGFKKIGENVFPIAKVKITDADGNILQDEANLFQEYYEQGAKYELLKEQIFISLNSTLLTKSKKLYIDMTIVDKHSDNAMIVKTELYSED